jgi:uncharacterized LabA/DUF88 family protein
MPTGQSYNVAAFIDVGFLTAEGARTLQTPRRAVKPNARGCVTWIRERLAAEGTGARLLRVYWYDGAFDPRDHRYESQRRYFDAIASTPGIQLRLGHLQEIRPRWQHALRKALEACGVDEDEFGRHFSMRPEVRQKGVDTRLTLDLVRLAQRRVYDTALLLAGDRDLAEPVRIAQDEGALVLSAAPERAGIANELRQLVDLHLELDTDDLRTMLDVTEVDADADTRREIAGVF